jgi:hypothetical protein
MSYARIPKNPHRFEKLKEPEACAKCGQEMWIGTFYKIENDKKVHYNTCVMPEPGHKCGHCGALVPAGSIMNKDFGIASLAVFNPNPVLCRNCMWKPAPKKIKIGYDKEKRKTVYRWENDNKDNK